MKAREGDILRDLNEIIFDVKGLVHPPSKIIAFPRFIPDSGGDRKHENIVYRKIYNISDRFKFLEQNFSHYIVYDSVFDERLCEVPIESVKKHYQPDTCLTELRHSEKLDSLEKDALEFLKLLKDYSDVSWSKMGISGSLLVKLHTPNSDIDPIVYGSKNCLKVYLALQNMLKNADASFKPYTREDLKALFDFRSKDTFMNFEDFVRVEPRKVLQGKFKGRDYFIRFVKEWSEIDEKYGETRYKNVGYAKIKAIIEDDSEAIFTPCNYKIKNVEILEGVRFPIGEIASFRGRFCEQARNSEVVIAQGKVEKVRDNSQNREFFRLLLGNKPSDHMILG
jgi:predicted nucleotidyltransferase